MTVSRYRIALIGLRKGWRIPKQMSWLFWPIGFKPPLPIERSFSITNRDEFMEVLRKLGAIR